MENILSIVAIGISIPTMVSNVYLIRFFLRK